MLGEEGYAKGLLSRRNSRDPGTRQRVSHATPSHDHRTVLFTWTKQALPHDTRLAFTPTSHVKTKHEHSYSCDVSELARVPPILEMIAYPGLRQGCATD